MLLYAFKPLMNSLNPLYKHKKWYLISLFFFPTIIVGTMQTPYNFFYWHKTYSLNRSFISLGSACVIDWVVCLATIQCQILWWHLNLISLGIFFFVAISSQLKFWTILTASWLAWLETDSEVVIIWCPDALCLSFPMEKFSLLQTIPEKIREVH